jgi:hypothetical protein
MLIGMLRSLNVVEGSFFTMGPPVTIFQYTITDRNEYFACICLFFVHQLFYTWLNEVVSPWIINEIQDHKSKQLSFSKRTTIIMINIYYAYFTLNAVITVNISVSQVSFLIAILSADVIATTVINFHYIWSKQSNEVTTDEEMAIGPDELEPFQVVPYQILLSDSKNLQPSSNSFTGKRVRTSHQ